MDDLAIVHCNFAMDLVNRGEYDQAIQQYNKVLELCPDETFAMFDLAWLLATCPDKKLRDPARAVRLVESHLPLEGPGKAFKLKVLAAVYAAVGRFDAAVAAAKKALHEAQSAADASLAEDVRRQLELYREGSAELSNP